MNQGLLFLILLALSSCGVNHHLRQAERHLKKAEQLGAKVRVDTFYVTKEVIVPEVKFDTLVSILRLTDTLTITKDRAVTKIKLDTLLKKVYISTQCLPDTVRLTIPVTVTKEIKSTFPWWYLAIAFFAGGFVIYLIRRKS